MTTNVRRSTPIPSELDVLAGVWLMVSPFLFSFPIERGAGLNNALSGAAIALLAWLSTTRSFKRAWPSWMSVLLGLWIVASPWVFGFAGLGFATSGNLVAGAVVALSAFWSAITGGVFADIPS